MKKIIYILSLFVVLFSSCQNELTDSDNEAYNKRRMVTFSFDIPDYHTYSREIINETEITKIALMEFDKDNQYIEHIIVDNVSGNLINVTISNQATTIHFIANYNGLDNYDDRSHIGQSAETVIPSLEVTNNQLVFWGKIDGISSSNPVELIRNQAKVTINAADNLCIEGFAICQYAQTGTVCPFNSSDKTFTYDDQKTTIGKVPTLTDAPSSDADDTNPKYMCEYDNTGNQTYVIIKGKLSSSTTSKYYKVLLMDDKQNPYSIVRNVNYIIKISELPDNQGTATFEAAKTSASINNLFAEVLKYSPSISADGKTLTVSPLSHAVCNDCTIESTVTISGTGTVTATVGNDPDNILSNVNYNGSKVTAAVKAVTKQCKATIVVKFGDLSRTITVIASPQYTFSYYVDNTSYTQAGADVKLTFKIGTNYPSENEFPDLYPIKCYITTENLYPTDEDGKNMLIEYANGTYRYQYLAYSTGVHNLNFKTKLGSVNDKLKVEIDGFTTSSPEISLTGKTN